MHRDGTVTGRKFIDHPVEKDRLYTDSRVISASQKDGNYKNHRLWRFINNYNQFIAIDTARKIVDFASENNCQVIVLEALSFKRKIGGSRARKITLWRKRDIAHRVESMTASLGIRVSYVCPAGTSVYAYDGSGKVARDEKNHRLCTFANGRQYNCDLSASYNIAARYFIRAIVKTVSEKRRLDIQAKVPELSKRTLCTLSTLISLAAGLSGSPDGSFPSEKGRTASAESTEAVAVSVEEKPVPPKGAALPLAV